MAEQGIPRGFVDHLDIICCPACGEDLTVDDATPQHLFCITCGHRFLVEDGIPHLFWQSKMASKEDVAVTEAVTSFYTEWPFPNYDDLDSAASLREKAKQGVFARMLDEQIPHGARVLEIGCGTGQLSNFLALTWGRTVFGTDMTLNSLRLGRRFQLANDLDTVFLQTNLFQPCFRERSFDFVICNGVLHHTIDPKGGFQSIVRLLKPGGFVVVGLYNTFGRMMTNVRRKIFRMLGPSAWVLDQRLRNKELGELRRKTWFMDQYRNPHESTHSMEEVLQWFRESNIDYVNAIPKHTGEQFSPDDQLFEPTRPGSKFHRAIAQLSMIFSGSREGGFFITIGRRRG